MRKIEQWRDYMLMSQPNHSGIIVCTFEPNPIRLADRINDAIEQLPSLDGQLIRIIRPSK